MKVAIIIPAAGLGTRMRPQPEKSGVSRKQFMLLDGEPILIHTLRKFAGAPSVGEIVIALRPEDRAWVEKGVEAAHISRPIRFVAGGESRQQSVENALLSLAPDTDLVGVHDAVRPFVDAAAIEKVIAEAAETGAAILGVVPVDTVKQVHRNRIRATIPRDRLVMAQTPQVFRYQLLIEAFAAAKTDNFTGTDEASLVERLEKVEVSVVPGSDRNIKITKPTDMELARLFLTEEKAK
ncbi:MAG: 2-C-methyl-D-erythritol 4-phosphate cytidylyltransferase [Candidatus Solibacter usitatus]|nr:2-C-methyl-D-erythritol 4-phosphate cytidylyltransferase [Candidatus Solibacter usitatus]